jgi:carbon-monoxide dehydrogenase small subunit
MRNPNPTEEQIRQDLSSNLCMCTGYVQIVEAVKEAAARLQQ